MSSNCAIATRSVRPLTPTYTVRPTFSTSPPSSVPSSIVRTSSPSRRAACSAPQCFAAPDLLPGSRDDGEILEDHERVLHEHRIGTLVDRFDLGDIPTGPGHRFHVRIPLATGEGDVDGLSFDVRDDALVERRARTADEGERARHEPVRSVSTSGSSNNADARRSWQS